MTVNSAAKQLNTLLRGGDFVVKSVPTNIGMSVNQKLANGCHVDIVAKSYGLQGGNLNSRNDSVAGTMPFFSKRHRHFGNRVAFVELFSFVNPVKSNTETGRLAQEDAEENLNLCKPQTDKRKTGLPNIKLIEPLGIPKGPKSGVWLYLQETIISVNNVVKQVDIWRHIILNLLRIFLNCDTRCQMVRLCAVSATAEQSVRPRR